jgi:hypothetical protein
MSSPPCSVPRSTCVAIVPLNSPHRFCTLLLFRQSLFFRSLFRFFDVDVVAHSRVDRQGKSSAREKTPGPIPRCATPCHVTNPDPSSLCPIAAPIAVNRVLNIGDMMRRVETKTQLIYPIPSSSSIPVSQVLLVHYRVLSNIVIVVYRIQTRKLAHSLPVFRFLFGQLSCIVECKRCDALESNAGKHS